MLGEITGSAAVLFHFTAVIGACPATADSILAMKLMRKQQQQQQHSRDIFQIRMALPVMELYALFLERRPEEKERVEQARLLEAKVCCKKNTKKRR